MDFFDNHKKLFLSALALFVGLTLIVAIIPAINNQNNNGTLPGYQPLTEQAYQGKLNILTMDVLLVIHSKFEM